MNTKILVVGMFAVFSVFCHEVGHKPVALSAAIINFELLAQQSPSTSTEELFTQQITQNGIIIVKFSSSLCPVCREYMPIFNEVAEQHPTITVGDRTENITYVHVDVDVFDALSDEWQVKYLPTTFFFKNGKRQLVMIGLQSKEMLVQKIAELVA